MSLRSLLGLAPLRRLTDSLWGAALGALCYAVWATAVNWDASPRAALTAGFAHFLMSTFLTYTGTALMRQFFRLGSNRIEGAVIAGLGGLGFTYALLIGVHYAIGTPHIWLTLAAGVIPTLLFSGGYALLLARTMPVIDAPQVIEPTPLLERTFP